MSAHSQTSLQASGNMSPTPSPAAGWCPYPEAHIFSPRQMHKETPNVLPKIITVKKKK